MEGLGILVGIGLVSAGVYAWLRVRKQVRIFSMALFGTSSLREGLEHQADILAETPKSVSGMTRLCLPRIEEDFPEFHWAQWKQRCENMLRGYLEALEYQDLSRLEQRGAVPGAGEERQRGRSGPGAAETGGGISEELRRQIEFRIREQQSRGVRERFRQVKIHQTEISRYQKEAGLCVIKLQSAVEYYYEEIRESQEGDGGEEAHVEKSPGSRLGRKRGNQKGSQQEKPGPLRQQNRYNMELVYVQDMTKAGDYATAVGATCPNCGAPITRLGSKFCEYCGTGVTPIDIRVWKLHRIEKE